MGARIIEKHFTDSNARSGPDHLFSMNPSAWKEMVLRSRELELAMGFENKVVEENEKETVILQRRSLRATRTLNKDDIIQIKDLMPLRPCPPDALQPWFIEDVIGKKLKRKINQNDYLKTNDI